MLAIILYLFGFLRTLFILVLLYFIIRWIRNYFGSSANSNQFNSNSRNNAKDDERGTTIKYNPKGEKIIDKDKGEYIDFEEVE